MKLPFDHFSQSFLRSFGQIMLQANAATGFLFLLGIGLNSAVMLVGSILAVLCALAVAQLGKFDAENIQQGLYGYNAALVGIAVWFLLPVNLTSLLLVIFGGALSTLLMHLMLSKLPKIPTFTAPFILSTWLLLIFIEYADLALLDRALMTADNATTIIDYIQASLRGVAVVMLQENALTGLIFLGALFCQSAKVAVWALMGSTLAVLVALSFSFSTEMIISGLYSFNACLVGIAMSILYPRKLGWIILTISLSVFITWAFKQLDLSALTAPFVLSTWLAIAIITVTKKKAV
ncbi:urea transporter [Colwellia piezophila]|uniref:urea transporter n=1 Tax=Colwellia piezophila TaxID=211668 RepID=UPI000367FB7B|nr:urea transporter [Colwellia piezophila]